MLLRFSFASMENFVSRAEIFLILTRLANNSLNAAARKKKKKMMTITDDEEFRLFFCCLLACLFRWLQRENWKRKLVLKKMWKENRGRKISIIIVTRIHWLVKASSLIVADLVLTPSTYRRSDFKYFIILILKQWMRRRRLIAVIQNFELSKFTEFTWTSTNLHPLLIKRVSHAEIFFLFYLLSLATQSNESQGLSCKITFLNVLTSC